MHNIYHAELSSNLTYYPKSNTRCKLTNTNYLTTCFTMIYENILSLFVYSWNSLPNCC